MCASSENSFTERIFEIVVETKHLRLQLGLYEVSFRSQYFLMTRLSWKKEILKLSKTWWFYTIQKTKSTNDLQFLFFARIGVKISKGIPRYLRRLRKMLFKGIGNPKFLSLFSKLSSVILFPFSTFWLYHLYTWWSRSLYRCIFFFHFPGASFTTSPWLFSSCWLFVCPCISLECVSFRLMLITIFYTPPITLSLCIFSLPWPQNTFHNSYLSC